MSIFQRVADCFFERLVEANVPASLREREQHDALELDRRLEADEVAE